LTVASDYASGTCASGKLVTNSAEYLAETAVVSAAYGKRRDRRSRDRVPRRRTAGNCQNDQAGPHDQRLVVTSSRATTVGRHTRSRYSFPA